ncbi:hypothetical protein OG542_00245 [Streptomyces violaceus]
MRRSAAVEVRGGVPGPGEMGTALDVLQLVTGNGWSDESLEYFLQVDAVVQELRALLVAPVRPCFEAWGGAG